MWTSDTEDYMLNPLAELKERDALIEALDAALLSKGVTARPAPGPWLSGLASQERAVLGALYGAYPKCLNRRQLLNIIPAKSRDPEDTESHVVNVLVSKLRRTFGKTAIINHYDLGWRLSPEFYTDIPKEDII